MAYVTVTLSGVGSKQMFLDFRDTVFSTVTSISPEKRKWGLLQRYVSSSRLVVFNVLLEELN